MSQVQSSPTNDGAQPLVTATPNVLPEPIDQIRDDAETAKVAFTKTRWGRWLYDRPTCTLTFRGYYQIDCEKFKNPAALLDSVFQVAGKDGIMRPTDLRDFLEALDVLIAPQATLCSGGVGKTIKNPRELIEKRFAAGKGV
jgi:hypothetical protein